MPDVDEERGGDGGTAGLVDELDVEVDGDAGLGVGDVCADELAVDVVGADYGFGDKGAGRVGGEEGGGGGVDGVVFAGFVGDVGPLPEGGLVPTGEDVFCGSVSEMASKIRSYGNDSSIPFCSPRFSRMACAAATRRATALSRSACVADESAHLSRARLECCVTMLRSCSSAWISASE